MGTKSRNAEGRKQMSDVAMARSYVGDIGGSGNGKSIVWSAFERLREMVELHRAANEAKAERTLLAQARKQHADFIEKTASMRALLEHQDEDFHGPEIARLRGVSRGVDRAGAGE